MTVNGGLDSLFVHKEGSIRGTIVTREGVTTRSIGDRWVDAKPVPGPFIVEAKRRLRECCLILTNRARAVRWY